MTAARYHQVMVSPLIGGAAKLAFEIQDWIATRRPGRAELLVPPGGAAEKYILERGFTHRTYDLERLLRPGRLASLPGNLEFFLKLRKPETGILHVHSPFVYGALRPFLRTSKLKKVLHIHLDYTVEQLAWPLQHAPDLIFLSAKSVKPTVEAALAQAAFKSPSKLRVLQNAVDVNRFFPADRATAKSNLGIDPTLPFLVLIANLAPHKGQLTALRAMASLVSMGKTAKLWIVGEERGGPGGYHAELVALRRDLGLDSHVEFIGFRDDIPEVLRAADFLLLPSTSETLSLVILEAQASKVVVLAAPTADIPEVVRSGQTGYLIAADNHPEYAQRLAQLIDDPQHRQAIAENAYQQIQQNFLMSRYCQAVLEEYDVLCPHAGS